MLVRSFYHNFHSEAVLVTNHTVFPLFNDAGIGIAAEGDQLGAHRWRWSGLFGKPKVEVDVANENGLPGRLCLGDNSAVKVNNETNGLPAVTHIVEAGEAGLDWTC